MTKTTKPAVRTAQAPSTRKQHPRADSEPDPKKPLKQHKDTQAKTDNVPRKKAKTRATAAPSPSTPSGPGKPSRHAQHPHPEPPVAPVTQTPQPKTRAAEVKPIRVDGRNKRTDDDAIEGGFAHVVNGEHRGAHGTFDHVLAYGTDGYPDTVAVLTRDTRQHLTVRYQDIRPDVAGRR